MNQVVLVGKMDSKHLDDKNRLNIRIICETRINGKFVDTEQQAYVFTNQEMAKKIYEEIDINSLIGVKGYLGHQGNVEIDKITSLNIE